MEFMDALGRRLGEVVKSAQEKSADLLNIGKLNLDIIKEEEAIRKLYRKIGELVYTAYIQNGNYAGAADSYCEEISEKKKRIDEINKKIEEIKKARAEQNKASDSGEDIVREAGKSTDIIDADSEVYSTAAVDSNEGICPMCGHKKGN